MNNNLPVVFYFKVEISKTDYLFTEVSGLTQEIEYETIYEGGGNDAPYFLPKNLKNSTIVLKRIFTPMVEQDEKWINDTLQNLLFNKIETKNIMIYLLDTEGKAIKTWSIQHAYPIKREYNNLNATSNELLIETLELAYHKLENRSIPMTKA